MYHRHPPTPPGTVVLFALLLCSLALMSELRQSVAPLAAPLPADVPAPVPVVITKPAGGWPFDFGQTLILIPLLVTGVVQIVSSIQLKKVHTLVNQQATDYKETIKNQDIQIKKLEDAALVVETETAERVRKEVEGDFRQQLVAELKAMLPSAGTPATGQPPVQPTAAAIAAELVKLLPPPAAPVPVAPPTPVIVQVAPAGLPVPVTLVEQPPGEPRA